jgi:hypothetical protein
MEPTAEAREPQRRTIPVLALTGLIRLYRLILSPWVGMHCRFHPSCSHYAEQALAVHGFWRGSWLTIRRLGRCHPWHEGGADPVPAARSNRIP